MAIETKALQKRYGKVIALDNLTMKVEQGEIYGFIGPNGAGKTTTIRILLGLIQRDGGEVKVLGQDPWSDAVSLHRRLAYVPGDVNLWSNLTGGEVIDMLGRFKGGLDQKLKAQMIERFNLDTSKKCGTYSKGNRQKVALVAAFASPVELFILDEPTSGLDPLMEAMFQECVAEVKKQGKTVILSSHILAEVEKLCDKVGIIRQGRIVESGTLDEMRHLTRTSITVVTSTPVTGLEAIAHNLSKEGDRLSFQVESKDLDYVLQHLSQFGVQALNSAPPTLEELFMRHYGDKVV